MERWRHADYVRHASVSALWSSQGGVVGVGPHPPCMHELAPCSLHVRVCAIYHFTLTIPCTYEGGTAAEVPGSLPAEWSDECCRR